MKKAVSIVLCMVLAMSIAMTSYTVNAAGWLSYARNVKLNSVFSDVGTTLDYHHPDSTRKYYDVFKFKVPAKGKIKFRVESNEDIGYSGAICNIVFLLYNSKNIDNKIWKGDSYNTSYSQYSSARGVYINEWALNLSKGTYYLAAVYDKYQGLDNNCDFRLSYKPTFANTSLCGLSSKKNAFNAKWNSADGVTGYKVQYSRKSSMKSSKTVTIKKKTKLSKTISNLQSGKTYYVRVRSYKKLKVNGVNKTYYGKWSAKKSVTIK